VNSELTPLGLVSRVRAVVGEDPTLSMRDVAARLAMAPRTLQRALSDAATTFHDERLEVRLELAASRLTRTTQKISAIAHEAGYASMPHFLSVFRARFGTSPRAFRQRHLRGVGA
jgi:AraC-like DNA-binding protein